MGCNSEYMQANSYEKQISRVACLLGEIERKPWKSSWWNGYHPDVYGRVTKQLGDRLTAELCGKLQQTGATQYSLEMQVWWRDHKKADKERIECEMREQATEAEKKAVLAKLTPHERDLLGL